MQITEETPGANILAVTVTRQTAVIMLVEYHAQGPLFAIVAANHLGSYLPSLVQSWQQDSHQQGDDGYDDQQLDQSECISLSHGQASFRPPVPITLYPLLGRSARSYK